MPDLQTRKALHEYTAVIWFSRIGALLFAAFVGFHIWASYRLKSPENGFDEVSLIALAVAVGLVFLPYIDSIAFGDLKIRFRALEAEMANTKEISSQAMEISKAADDASKTGDSQAMFVASAAPDAAKLVSEVDNTIRPGPEPDDPWKGQFGGHSTANGRRLSARVSEIIGDAGWFLISLVVDSIDSRRPLQGSVEFFLHDSFPNPHRSIPVIDGRAELRLRSWGAFTVGVLADSGKTHLELDLAEDVSFPSAFRER